MQTALYRTDCLPANAAFPASLVRTSGRKHAGSPLPEGCEPRRRTNPGRSVSSDRKNSSAEFRTNCTPFFLAPAEVHHPGFLVTEDSVNSWRGTKSGEPILVPKPSLFPHPLFIQDFQTPQSLSCPVFMPLPITSTPENHPLDWEKSLKKNRKADIRASTFALSEPAVRA